MKWLKTLASQYQHVLAAFLPMLSLLSTCVLHSSKKYFWYDELLSFSLITDTSLSRMLHALADAIDTSPPLYYIVGWLWVHVFGSTELSLRLLSSLCLCLTCAAIYAILRHLYGIWPALIGVLTVFCGSEMFVYQNSEARFYGFFLMLCALGLLLYYKVCTTATDSFVTLCLLTIIHGSIVLTHVYGFWYSGVMLAALIVRDRVFKRFRPKLYLSIALGWLLFFFWYPAFLKQIAVTQRDFWIPTPDIKALMEIYEFKIVPLAVVLIGILALKLFTKHPCSGNSPASPSQNPDEQNRAGELSFALVNVALLSVPILSWLISQTRVSIFLDRYFLPSALPWSFFIAYLLSWSLRGPGNTATAWSRSRFKLTLILVLLAGILLLYPLYTAIVLPSQRQPGVNDLRYGHTNLPIVSASSVISAGLFMVNVHYAPDTTRYFYLLDAEVASDTSSLFMDNLMSTMERYYLPAQVVNTQEFLATTSAFLILHSPEWFEARILNNPEFQVTILRKYTDAEGGLVLVQKRL